MQDDDMYAVWPEKLTRGGGPRYRQIADFIAQAVLENRLLPGDRLPPQRGLAQRLGVDLTTVTRAYAEAGQRGLLDPRGALGTFIARPAAQSAQLIDLGMNMPPAPLGCDLQDLVQHGLGKVMDRHDVNVMMAYHLAGGGPEGREAGAQWLAQAVGPIDPALVLVCPGAQAALAALILACSQPGDSIVAEPLVYPGLLSAAQHLGRQVLAAEADADGMTPAGLERACRESGSRLVYLNPTLQNPTAHTMSAQRRRDLVRSASACGAMIIEDDPYRLFLDDAPPPLASYAPASVFHIATLAKCLTPGLRTAFVLSPDQESREQVLAAMRSFALMATPLMGALTTQWIVSGTAQVILNGVRAEAQARQRLARQLLPGPFHADPVGIHVWQTLPAPWTAMDLARVARDEGLSVTSSDAFQVGAGAGPNAIRISLGGVKDRQALAHALDKLAELMRRRPYAHRDPIV
ncbi:PLP-dependent aminotransferase family protein [Achromobacter seleniivolatilans]|uniref:PLP-dependent aminotransferase family protein n=1 Tax=Achromobacter seleniivolatilans TaxID=3047478 RepID=A0ABY9M1I2_9BURK|nr:PLP-dependent aminotransferase family protein [Achromobacter sp. R39]WMD20856.1 PLP-dependent aminotransferase family protein [Achromobacter sp. R39]